MKQLKRSLSLILTLALLLSMVYIGPAVQTHAASASTYIATSYAANLSVKTTQTVNLMQYPTTASTAKYTLPVDTMLTVRALHKNTSGAYFYEVLYYGMTLYIDATATTLVDHLTGDVTIDNVQSPASLAYGNSFSIYGDITSSLNDLGTVTAAMYTSTNIAKGPYMEVSDDASGKSYSLNGSTIDSNMTFGSIAAGVYTYVVTAEAISYYIDDNDQFATSAQTVVLETQQCVVTDWTDANPQTGFGIDVSTWQGSVDWSQVQYDVDFAILRIGFSETLDNRFLEYAEGCETYDIPYGVYHYSYAVTAAEAQAEAEFVINTLQSYGYNPEMYIWFDMEDSTQASLSSSIQEAIVTTFCDTIAEAGYQPGFYGFTSWFDTTFQNGYLSSIPVWIAQIDGFSSAGTATHDGGTWLWQYSWEGSISGISGDVDCNICYFEYPGTNTDTSYLASCTYYPARAIASTTGSANMRQYPSSSYSSLGTVSSGTQVEITGLYKNASGEYWYQVVNGSTTGYIHSNYISISQMLYDDLSVIDPIMATNLDVGSGYYLRGTLNSQYNTIYTTYAKIYSGEDTLADPVISSKYTNNSKNYNLYKSTVCNNLSFGSLSAGYYTYEISADVRNYYVSSGSLTYETENVVVWTAPLNVGSVTVEPPADVACDHNIVTDAAVAAGCTTTGLTEGSHCSKCGVVFTAQTVVPAAGHSYSATSKDATCSEYELFHYTCSKCGDSYDIYADELAQWSETKPLGVSSSLIESKVQYRYSDYQTKTSYETSLEGWTLKSSEWVQSGTGTVYYVPSWPSGFDTSNSLYTKYNNTKKTASETSTTKTVINSDALAGYLYYHWCSSTDSNKYSYASKSSTHTIFHAYYSTTAPSNYTCDTSDNSYKTSNSTCSNGNSLWFFYTDVYAQSYTTYNKLFTYEGWSDYSDWSDTAVTASSTRKVETRTVYRYTGAQLGEHTWNSGVITTAPTCTSTGIKTYTCTACGATKTETISIGGHSYTSVVTAPTCTAQGYTTHTCANCGGSYIDSYVSAAGHSYKTVVTAPTCTSQGYTTHTCTACGSSYVDTYVKAAGHSWTDGVCSVCGEVCEHSTTENGICTVCGHVVVLPTVKPTSYTLALKDEVQYYVYFTVENADIPTTDMGLITWSTPRTDGTIDNAHSVIAGVTYDSTRNRYLACSDGIPAKELGDTLYFKVYARLSNGTYIYSDLYNYSAEQYAYYMLEASSDSRLHNLLISMLNYGAEAQKYFGYKTYDLVNAGLTDTQKNSLNAYSSSLMDSIVKADSSKTTRFAYTKEAFSSRGVTVTAGGALALNFRFTPAYTMDGDMTLYYWDTATYNDVSALTLSNATGSAKMTMISGAYQASVTDIAAKDIDKTIYAVGIYQSEGITYTTGVISYNLNTYFDQLAQADPACTAVCEAAVVYCDYAKFYFLGT